LQKSAEMVIPLPREIIVLSKSDFDRAIESARRNTKPRRVRETRDASGKESKWYPADLRTRRLAAQVASLANDVRSLGLTATFERSEAPKSFHGHLFIVVDEPQLDSMTGILEATQFRVAAIELTGTTSWVGQKASLAFSGPVTGQINRCCG